MASSKQKAVERNRARHKAGEGESDLATVAEAMGVKPKEAPAKVEPTKTTAEVTAETKVRGGPSIRGLITKMVGQGKSTAEITEAIKEQFPNSRAAAIPSKHISFYRSRMKKDNPASVPETGAVKPPTTVVAKKGAAKKAVATGAPAEAAE